MPDARFRRRPYIGAGEMQNANMYEDYLHLHPARGQTLSEITGVEPQGNAPLLVTEIYGKRMGGEGYLEVQKGGFLERVDAISRSKVPELIEEKAQEDARIDIQQYFTGK